MAYFGLYMIGFILAPLIAFLLKRYGEPVQAFIEKRMALVGWLFLAALAGGFAAVALL